MQAGDVSIRKAFEGLVPWDRAESRDTWFSRVARTTGLRKARVKSLYYSPKCRLWAEELTCLERAIERRNAEAVQTAKSAVQRAETLLETMGNLKNEDLQELGRCLRPLLHLAGSGSPYRLR